MTFCSTNNVIILLYHFLLSYFDFHFIWLTCAAFYYRGWLSYHADVSIERNKTICLDSGKMPFCYTTNNHHTQQHNNGADDELESHVSGRKRLFITLPSRLHYTTRHKNMKSIHPTTNFVQFSFLLSYSKNWETNFRQSNWKMQCCGIG